MTRIVTTHYRYKSPPRKRKAVALEVPAIVRTKKIAARVDDPSGERKGWVTPTQHSTPAEPGREPPVTAAEKVPAIVTTASRKQTKQERAARSREDRPQDLETADAMRAWLEKAGRGPAGCRRRVGTGGPTAPTRCPRLPRRSTSC